MDEERFAHFRPIFSPKSIAVFGASDNRMKFGYRFLRALLDSPFEGGIYPINPRAADVDGLRAYPDVCSVPDPVEYAMICVPAAAVPDVIRDCAQKGVKAVQIFTAGFRETGNEAGLTLETEIVRIAREGGVRIIGPNCIGIHCPASGVPYGPMPLCGESGPVAFISQSGGHAGNIVGEGMLRGIRFSKVVSYGNGCDLDSPDFLEYFAADPETLIIGAYIEGIRDSRRFFEMARETSRTKPIILWKGGQTLPGAETAASHTGSLAAADAVWKGTMKQAGVVKVESFEELADTILAFCHLPFPAGKNVAVITGISGGGGGTSVASTDALTFAGLSVPPFTDETREALKDIVPRAGSILRNPLDLAGAHGQIGVITRAVELVMADPSIDSVILHERLETFTFPMASDNPRCLADVLLEQRGRSGKPLLVVVPYGFGEENRSDLQTTLCAGNVPVFPTIPRAARAIANLLRYVELHGDEGSN